MPESKRRTTTSTASKRRYNTEHYANFQTWIAKEDHAKINEYIKSQGMSKAEFVKKAYEVLAQKG